MIIRKVALQATKIFIAMFCLFSQASEISPIDDKAVKVPSLIEQVVIAIDERYGGETFNRDIWNQRKSHFLLQTYSTKGDEHRAIKTLLSALNEPSVRFLKPEEKAVFLQEVSGKFTAGIGLLELLSIDIDERTGRLTVITPFPNTAAARAGLKSGDQLITIDKVPTSSLSLSQSMARLRGKPDTALTLDVNRDGKALSMSIIREAEHDFTDGIKVSTRKDKGKLIGHIQYRFVANGSSVLLREEITALVNRGIDSIILDLRNNPGGVLLESVSVAELFLPKGTHIATIQAGQNKIVQEYRSTNEPIWDGPVIVLQNNGTASAAELISGSLQANKRALVIGQKSFGKGLVHTLAPLSDGSAVLFHTGRLFLPNGRDILHDMIDPDDKVELNFSPSMSNSQKNIEGSTDLQYWVAVKRLEN